MKPAFLIRQVRPIGFSTHSKDALIDLLLDEFGRVMAIGALDPPKEKLTLIEGGGHYLSPGWIDLHTHIWRGGTDLSVDPSVCGLARGVTTLVDAGSAGEANFAGFEEFIIRPAKERVYAFLNVGSIGLTASHQVSELSDWRHINLERIIACVEKYPHIIKGLKVRASGMITGNLDIAPVKMAKRIATMLKRPLMVHVGEPPPLLDDVLSVLSSGDIVTHCFNGKACGSIFDDPRLFDEVKACADRGIRFDIGHGAASFSFDVGKRAIAEGLFPFSISTDLHLRSIDKTVWDLGTTMSKLLALGMSLEKVIHAVTAAPASVVGLYHEARLEVGRLSDFTIFSLDKSELVTQDAMGHRLALTELITPRAAFLGATYVAASPYRLTHSAVVACAHGEKTA